MAHRDAVRHAVREVAATLGEIGVRVNNAGILRTASFLEVRQAECRETMAVNLDAVFHGDQAVRSGMLARATGCIVNLSSGTGKRGGANPAA